MFGRLLLLFVGVPLLEMALLVWMGSRVGLVPTLGLVVVTGIVGAALARQQGGAAWQRFQRAMGEGRLPHQEVLDGLLILLAAAVLLTPGVLTDSVGFLLLAPPVRRRIRDRIADHIRRKFVVGSPHERRTGDVIDVTAVVEDQGSPTDPREL